MSIHISLKKKKRFVQTVRVSWQAERVVVHLRVAGSRQCICGESGMRPRRRGGHGRFRVQGEGGLQGSCLVPVFF